MSGSVDSWYTTGATQASLFAPGTPIARTPYDGTSGTRPVTVDAATTHQAMLGFGATLTDAAASVIWSMPAPARSALLTELFDPIAGHGISMLRLTIGTCDFARGDYTYDDNGGAPDPTLTAFSIAHDLDAVVPLARAALALNPQLTLIAAPWSPPSWMKSGSSGLNGGTLDPAYYPAFARYLVRYVQAYAAQGLPIHALSVQNEPENRTDYPSMGMTAAQQVTLVGGHVGPAFAAAGLSTKIMAYDHNWSDTAYPETVLADPVAGRFVDGVAWHGYAGDVAAQSTVHSAYPGKNTYFTEITASQPGDFQGDLQWHMRNIVLGAPNNQACCTTHWNLALNEDNGPLNGGYTSGQGLIRVDSSTAAVTRYAPYYAVIHASSKVRPGALRISCTSYGTGYVIATAYLNPDGSRVVVLECDAGSAQTFKVIEGGQEFTLTMQPGDVGTYLLPADAATTVSASAATSPVTISGLSAGSYTFTVSARNAAGAGPASPPDGPVNIAEVG